ncbi:stress-induced-phosphoprotein 1 [Fistulifera solaris]|uniref:Hsp70-Hsp90 organising protein n=1 Tax=Fistulifera solaris TaxID=1519565 RepID=A0A1Z5K961_FISSO|nr:stress-induced-phosphoprotein 1 [Fistulifera solaris]|eukprot:GAX22809.1 stress-induced-phosphoprotein 1 [Fistulifera solaris]
MTTAEEHKALGNTALQAGNFTKAIEEYSAAIRLDGTNHVYYSNRSAAYLSKDDAPNALEDANACIALNPTFVKGYSRKGAALHALKRYNDAIAAFEEGLKIAPGDAALIKGLESVKQEQKGGPGPVSGLFGPEMMSNMARDPRLAVMLQDPDIQAKIRLVQSNPEMLQSILQDPKMMKLFSLMMVAPEEEEEKPAARAPAPAPVPEPEPEEDWSQLSPEERAEKEKQKAANEMKKKGNDLYKDKKFDEALAAYDQAIAIDPTNMAFHSNKAAVYLTSKQYDECIEACMKAVEVGKENRASFEDRAKAYARAAKAYQKKGDLEKAIEMCNEAQLESYDSATQRLLKTLELEKKKADTLAYQDDAKAEEAKQKGNDFFRAQQWPQAVEQYEEAVKRAPKNAAIRNNLAAALCKIMDFNGAIRQIEEALALDPKYVKAYARKGDIEMYRKEFHKAMDSYNKGLSIEPDNKACLEGLSKCRTAIQMGRRNMTAEEKQEQAAHAMADPEIQSIVSDPIVQQVLRDLQENPASIQQVMQDANMRSKIEKLIASGIIETA